MSRTDGRIAPSGHEVDHVVEDALAGLVRGEHTRIEHSRERTKGRSWIAGREHTPHDAQDVVQQTAVELVDLHTRQYFHQTDPDHRRRALASVYGSRLRDRSWDESQRKQRATARHQSIEEMAERGADPTLSIPDPSPEPLELLVTIEAKNELLGHIPARHRGLIAAKLNGADYEELAHAHNVSEPAVRQAVKRGLDRARKSLEAAA